MWKPLNKYEKNKIFFSFFYIFDIILNNISFEQCYQINNFEIPNLYAWELLEEKIGLFEGLAFYFSSRPQREEIFMWVCFENISISPSQLWNSKVNIHFYLFEMRHGHFCFCSNNPSKKNILQLKPLCFCFSGGVENFERGRFFHTVTGAWAKLREPVSRLPLF